MEQTTEMPRRLARAELEELLRRTALGEREAFAGLYEQTRGAVYAMALSVLKNAYDAQDVTQDAFVRVWSSAGGYTPKGTPMAWILTIARNLALMRLRENTRLGGLPPEEWDAIAAPAPAVTPEDRAVLQDALAELEDEERQIVLLHASSGLKHREIAALLSLPLSTVLSKYHRALKKLRQKGDDAL